MRKMCPVYHRPLFFKWCRAVEGLLSDGVMMTASTVPSYRGYALVLHLRYWIECKADTTDSSHYLA